MSDIVERLRAHGSKTEMEAADEIERLQAIIKNVALAIGHDSSPLLEEYGG